jgi:hypothetical protein
MKLSSSLTCRTIFFMLLQQKATHQRDFWVKWSLNPVFWKPIYTPKGFLSTVWPERALSRPIGIGGIKGHNMNDIKMPGSPAVPVPTYRDGRGALLRLPTLSFSFYPSRFVWIRCLLSPGQTPLQSFIRPSLMGWMTGPLHDRGLRMTSATKCSIAKWRGR